MDNQLPYEIDGTNFVLQIINKSHLLTLKKLLELPQIAKYLNLKSHNIRKSLWINSKSLIYVVFKNNQAYGWVGARNFHKNENSCTIEIVIHPKLWGIELNSDILTLFEYILKKKLEIRFVIAHVHQNNYRAVKFFEKNCYTLSKSNNTKSIILTYEKHLEKD